MIIKQAIQSLEQFTATILRNIFSMFHVELVHRYDVVCYAPDGRVKWRDRIKNITVNVGLNDILDKYWKGAAYTAAHYVGLTAGTPTIAAADTMAAHAGWTEVTAYDEAVRQTLTLGSVASQSVDNSASKAVFTISTNQTTIGGVFITTVSTKGGATGTLVCGAALSAGNKLIDDNDTITVTVTLSMASA